ncbi:MAG TPA: thioredoxin domain-containing protein [Polyangiaceae bacterium]|nr:thioredoxin domain-containing protein [Polyangiaceae bacterium]
MLRPPLVRAAALAFAALLAACSLRSASGEPARAATTSAAKSPLAQPGGVANGGLASAVRQPSSLRVPIRPGDAVWGSPTAPVTIVEFTDLECPFCARVEASISELEKRYGAEQLRIVVKHFPFHDHSEQAARVAQAVLLHGGSDAFFRFITLAFQHQDLLGSEAALRQFAVQSGVDADRASAAAQSPEVTDKLATDAELVHTLGVTGTPTFFINGKRLVGAQPLTEFTSLVDLELAAARALLAQGMAAELVYARRVGENAAGDALLAGPPREKEAQERADESDGDSVIWKVPIAGTPLRGPATALVTIVEFSDYECPYCRRAEETLDKLFELYPDKLRLSRRENPLPFHKHALAAATFALEARAQRGDAGYYEAGDKLYLSGLEPEHLDDIAGELKLDITRVRRAISSQAHRATIERDQDLALSLNAMGTPHFFINGWRVSGAQPLSQFREVIDAQLKVAEALVKTGVAPARVYDELLKRGKEAEPPARWSLPPPAADLPSRGPKSAPVVIEIFGDLQCVFCAHAQATLAEIEKRNAGKVRIVWHHLPLESLHPHARMAARAVVEARVQKGDLAFFRLVELFYRDQNASDAFTDARLSAYARELGLDAERLLAASKDSRHDAVIDADLALADQADIHSTPSFSINGYELTGAQPAIAFQRIIRYALAQPTRPPAKKPSSELQQAH